MNYKFIFDEDFYDKYIELSSEELKVVIATVLGGHNALFYGYKPERLVNAIKLLSKPIHIEEPGFDISLEKFCGGGPNLQKGVISNADKGILIMNNIRNFKYSIYQILPVFITKKNITLSRAGNTLTYPCDFQLIATTTSLNDFQDKLLPVTQSCDVIYYCKEGIKRDIKCASEVTSTFGTCYNMYIHSCIFRKNCSANISKLRITSVAIAHYGDPDIKIKRVAKTLAAMNNSCIICKSNITDALNFTKVINN